MAITATKFSLFMHLLVLLLQLSVLISTAASAVCTTKHGCFYTKAASAATYSNNLHNRKVIYYEVEKLKFGFGWKGEGGVSSKNDEVVEWALRRVPAGPDPLHHNGATPKKPRTP